MRPVTLAAAAAILAAATTALAPEKTAAAPVNPALKLGGETAAEGFSHLMPAFSNQETRRIIRLIDGVEAECRQLEVRYRFDCFGIGFQQVARQIRRPDYREVRTALERASRSINQEVRRNLDAAAPRVSPRRPDANRSGRRQFRAVRQQAVRAVSRAARTAVERASSTLLRSAQRSQQRRVHYTQIARAVDSTTLLMRA
ncbi:MAG: hypothetical protein AAGF45_12080 [Pseudomonadota bacterium]